MAGAEAPGPGVGEGVGDGVGEGVGVEVATGVGVATGVAVGTGSGVFVGAGVGVAGSTAVVAVGLDAAVGTVGATPGVGVDELPEHAVTATVVTATAVIARTFRKLAIVLFDAISPIIARVHRFCDPPFAHTTVRWQPACQKRTEAVYLLPRSSIPALQRVVPPIRYLEPQVEPSVHRVPALSVKKGGTISMVTPLTIKLP